MANDSITIRFARKDLERIDEMVHQGYYTSRSDLIRTGVRHLIFDMAKAEEKLEGSRRFAEENGITMEDIRKTIREVRPQLYKDVYGDD